MTTSTEMNDLLSKAVYTKQNNGHIMYYDRDEKLKYYDTNEQLVRSECQHVSVKKAFDENGQLKYEYSRLNDYLHGYQRIYNKNVLVYEGVYKDGLKHGVQKTWDEFGNPKTAKCYIFGQLRGPQKEWVGTVLKSMWIT